MPPFRSPNLFEKLLLIVGVGVGIVGIYILYNVYTQTQNVPLIVGLVFLWLIVILLLMVVAIAEDIKEEIGVIMHEQVEQIKLLRNINDEMLEEIKLLSGKRKGSK